MQPVRDAAAELVAEGEIEVTQKGEVVALEGVKGPIRLRKVTNTVDGSPGDEEA
jgi:hypothetical protein